MEAIEIADVLLENRFSDQEPMRTTIDIDDTLMRKARQVSGLITKKAVVEAALRLLIQTYSKGHRPWMWASSNRQKFRKKTDAPCSSNRRRIVPLPGLRISE